MSFVSKADFPSMWWSKGFLRTRVYEKCNANFMNFRHTFLNTFPDISTPNRVIKFLRLKGSLGSNDCQCGVLFLLFMHSFLGWSFSLSTNFWELQRNLLFICRWSATRSPCTKVSLHIINILPPYFLLRNVPPFLVSLTWKQRVK